MADVPQRRWFQFGIRTVLVLTFGVAMYCAGWQAARWQAKRELDNSRPTAGSKRESRKAVSPRTTLVMPLRVLTPNEAVAAVTTRYGGRSQPIQIIPDAPTNSVIISGESKTVEEIKSLIRTLD